MLKEDIISGSDAQSECDFQMHPFPPVFDENSRVLILGSFPSVKSREEGFFYGHPRNRFWPLIAALTGENVPISPDEKKKLLFGHGIALWDVISECNISGSADASIKNAHPNDLTLILKCSSVEKIYTNGNAAYKIYNRLILPKLGIEAEVLPSSSPANASFGFERLLEKWSVISEFIIK